MLTRQLQAAADDLGAVECALVALLESLPPRPIAEPTVKAAPARREQFRMGYCSEFSHTVGRPCSAAASRYGLCYTHFAELLGHHFYSRECRYCGVRKLDWAASGPAGADLKAQNREFCPLNGKSARAEEILAAHLAQKIASDEMAAANGSGGRQ